VLKKLALMTLLLFLILSISATSLMENLETLSKDNAEGYLQPLVNVAGTGLNSGFYNSAKVLKPFTPNFRLGFTFVSIPDDEKTFTATSSGSTTTQTATIFGGNKGVHPFPKGADISTVMIPHLSGSLGLPLGNEIMLRYLPPMKNLPDEIGEINFWGVGVKHSLDQYLTDFFPIDISVQAVWQQLSVAEKVKISTQSYNIQAGKKVLMLTVYGGVAYEMANLKVDYTPHDTNNQPLSNVNLDLDAENEMKVTLGLRYSILLFDAYADYNIAKYPSVNLGVGVGF